MNNVYNIEQSVCRAPLPRSRLPARLRLGRQQLTEFIEDIELLPEGKDHYTGTIVLHPANGGNLVCEDEDGKHYATVFSRR